MIASNQLYHHLTHLLKKLLHYVCNVKILISKILLTMNIYQAHQMKWNKIS